MTDKAYISAYCQAAVSGFSALSDQSDRILQVADMLCSAVDAGGKILLCGNGGSAADAQHLAAEFIGRFEKERRSIPALALTTDSSILTAVSNDYAFEMIFARQIEGLGAAGDVLVALSTSGNSANVVKAVEAATGRGIQTVGLTGQSGGALAPLCDVAVQVPSDITSHIQEMHIAVGHMICAIVETRLT